MWTCPKCGRNFKRQNQDHYCGKAPETIDEYISSQLEEIQRYYPGPEAVEVFSEKLKEYKTSKGTIQFPYNKPLPLELIAEIAKWCYS